MEYRPKEWKNPHSPPIGYDGIDELLDTNTGEVIDGQVIRKMEHAYEAGASALLKALREGSVVYVPANHFFTSFPLVQPVNGAWVFIPDNPPEVAP